MLGLLLIAVLAYGAYCLLSSNVLISYSVLVLSVLGQGMDLTVRGGRGPAAKTRSPFADAERIADQVSTRPGPPLGFAVDACATQLDTTHMWTHDARGLVIVAKRAAEVRKGPQEWPFIQRTEVYVFFSDIPRDSTRPVVYFGLASPNGTVVIPPTVDISFEELATLDTSLRTKIAIGMAPVMFVVRLH